MEKRKEGGEEHRTAAQCRHRDPGPAMASDRPVRGHVPNSSRKRKNMPRLRISSQGTLKISHDKVKH